MKDISASKAFTKIDGTVKFTSQRFSRSIDTSIPMASGKHRITVKAWDIGGPFFQTYTLTVP